MAGMKCFVCCLIGLNLLLTSSACTNTPLLFACVSDREDTSFNMFTCRMNKEWMVGGPKKFTLCCGPSPPDQSRIVIKDWRRGDTLQGDCAHYNPSIHIFPNDAIVCDDLVGNVVTCQQMSPSTQIVKAVHTGTALETAYTGSALETAHISSSLETTHTGSALETAHTGSALETAYTGSALETAYTGSALETAYTGSALETVHISSSLETTHTGSALETPHPKEGPSLWDIIFSLVSLVVGSGCTCIIYVGCRRVRKWRGIKELNETTTTVASHTGLMEQQQLQQIIVEEEEEEESVWMAIQALPERYLRSHGPVPDIGL